MGLEIFTIFLCVCAVDSQTWMTHYTAFFRYACPAGKTLKSLVSMHDSRYHDRVWNFVCASAPNGAVLSNCEWSGVINDLDQLLEYQCPSESIMCGVEGAFDFTKKDRKWSYLCCKPEGFVTHACEYTPFVNSYENMLNYRVPDDFVLRGITSVHDNSHEDRIFKFDICKLNSIGTSGTVIVG